MSQNNNQYDFQSKLFKNNDSNNLAYLEVGKNTSQSSSSSNIPQHLTMNEINRAIQKIS